MGEKEEVLREGNISLILDSYNDLFSDFDPRNYSERALSDDFLVECKRAARDQESGAELRLLIPSKKRNTVDELKIKQRLKAHFHRHFKENEKAVNSVLRRGIYFVIAGIIFMFLATTLHFKFPETSFITSFFIILLEPAGWFSFWEGLNQIIFDSKKKKPDLEFYKKMTNVKISFISYSA